MFQLPFSIPIFVKSFSARCDRLEGSTTFQANYGRWGGAIFNQAYHSSRAFTHYSWPYRVPVITFPDDTVFDANYGLVSPTSRWKMDYLMYHSIGRANAVCFEWHPVSMHAMLLHYYIYILEYSRLFSTIYEYEYRVQGTLFEPGGIPQLYCTHSSL